MRSGQSVSTSALVLTSLRGAHKVFDTSAHQTTKRYMWVTTRCRHSLPNAMLDAPEKAL